MYRCLKFVPNAAQSFDLIIQDGLVYVTDDLAAYLRALERMGDGTTKLMARNQLFLRTIEPHNVAFMKQQGIGYRFIIPSGAAEFGKTSLYVPRMGEAFRGSIPQSKLFLEIFAQPSAWKRAHLSDIVNDYLSTGYRYMPEEVLQRTGVDLPASARGLSPDYRLIDDPIYQHKPLVFENDPDTFADLSITLMGDHDAEVRLANKLVGLGSETPELYVWNHLDDFDPVTGKCTMQLVLKEFHNQKVYGNVLRHVGGSGLYRQFYFITRGF